jgi:hypothetical protein
VRVVFPIKHYKDEGFVERKIEINEEDLTAIIEEYLLAHDDFEFDQIKIVNNRPMNEGVEYRLRARIYQSFGEDVFRVSIKRGRKAKP